MAKLSIHTATYNRAYILGKAYESLKNQTCKDFEWIITDDGSEDKTESMVKEWMNNQDNGFDIIYNKLSHVGIPRALNSGVNHSNTEWFMMLDSDDFIKPNTVELVLKWLSEIKDNKSFAGIGFARSYPNGDYMKKQMPKIDPNIGYVDASHIERKLYNLDMDMCEVHRVAVLKKYPFQCWKDEKYAPEQLNFYEMALAGLKLRWRREKLYICEYLPDGQTKDDHLVKNNPMGFAMMYNQNILLSATLKEKWINTIRMTALAVYAGHTSYLFTCNAKGIALVTLPAGIMLAIRRNIQYRKLK
jgi:glycosyltransferase involved in cell wall biosynthesis